MAELTGRSIAHTPSHFIPLSSWLRESNYFHLLRAIRFFRTYLAAKVFRLWRANVRRRRLAYAPALAHPLALALALTSASASYGRCATVTSPRCAAASPPRSSSPPRTAP